MPEGVDPVPDPYAWGSVIFGTAVLGDTAKGVFILGLLLTLLSYRGFSLFIVISLFFTFAGFFYFLL